MRTTEEVMAEWVAAYNRRDAAALAALYHDEAVNLQLAVGTPTVGRDAVLRDAESFFRAFPDNFTRVENLVVANEWAALEWSGGATWLGEFLGQPPNGRSFTLRGCGFFRIVNGKIREQRGYWDRASWFRQLGLPVEN